MTLIQEIAEETRREMLQCQRAAVRSGAKYYARSARTRANSLRRMGVVEPALPALKLQLRSLMQARKSGAWWRYNHAKYIAVMQCIGGEMILAKKQAETLQDIAAE